MKVVTAFGFIVLAMIFGTILPGFSAVPQRPEQTEFNSHVVPGAELMVTTNGEMQMSSPFCTTVESLQEIWGHNESDNPHCESLMTGSRVTLLAKTNQYAIDDPTQPIVPYGNDAHLIAKVRLVKPIPSLGLLVEHPLTVRVGQTGYMMIDDLDYPSRVHLK